MVLNTCRRLVWLSVIVFNIFVSNPIYARFSPSTITKTAADVRLYTLNCGYMDIHNMAPFSDTNLYPHKPIRLADPLFFN